MTLFYSTKQKICWNQVQYLYFTTLYISKYSPRKKMEINCKKKLKQIIKK